MIKQVAHIGITIKDMDKSIHFYHDILGLKFLGDLIMEGKETDILFHRQNVKVKVAYLKGDDELITPAIELLEFLDKKVDNESDLFKTSISEICFTCLDIDATYKRLKNLGVKFLSEPQEFDFTKDGFNKSKAVYFYDPDGIILELMQYY